MPSTEPSPRKRAPAKAGPAPDTGAGPAPVGGWPEDPTTVALLGQILSTAGTQLELLETISKQLDALADLTTAGVSAQGHTRAVVTGAWEQLAAQGPLLTQLAEAAPRLLAKIDQLPTTPAAMIKGVLGGRRRAS